MVQKVLFNPNARRAYTCLGEKMQNPVMTFYSLLARLLADAQFDSDLAEALFKIRLGTMQISLPNVSLESLEEMYSVCHARNAARRHASRYYETVARHCFIDLSAQLRTRKARELCRQWQEMTEFVTRLHVRRVTDLGNGYRAVTLVTNDERWVEHPREQVWDFDVIRTNALEITSSVKPSQT